MAGLYDKQAAIYAAARPDYPDSLYEFLASLTPGRDRCWDVGTGNGQAAAKLAEIFKEVIATDLSAEQLKHAVKKPNITYASTSKLITPEELHSVVGPENSIDLITVAQALHWFELKTFYAHVSSVLRKDPPGVFAPWCYQLCTVDPQVDSVIQEFYAATGPYWEPERELVDAGYKTLPFPFEPVTGGSTGPFRFETSKRLNLEQLLRYFRSWSAIQTGIDKGINLLEKYTPAFERAWGGDPSVVKTVTWPVLLFAGKCSPAT